MERVTDSGQLVSQGLNNTEARGDEGSRVYRPHGGLRMKAKLAVRGALVISSVVAVVLAGGASRIWK